jgi:hypothetical protein
MAMAELVIQNRFRFKHLPMFAFRASEHQNMPAKRLFRPGKTENWGGDLVFACILGYAMFTRSASDVQTDLAPWFAVYWAAALLIGLVVTALNMKVPSPKNVAEYLVTSFWGCLTVSLWFYSALIVLTDLSAWAAAFAAQLDPLRNRTQFMVVTGLTTASVGAMFFWARLRQRFLYGATEAMTGAVVGMHRVTVDQWTGVPVQPDFSLALLTAGIYLVVRGADNMHQAAKSGQDPFLRRLARTKDQVAPARRLRSSRWVRRKPRRRRL